MDTNAATETAAFGEVDQACSCGCPDNCAGSRCTGCPECMDEQLADYTTGSPL